MRRNQASIVLTLVLVLLSSGGAQAQKAPQTPTPQAPATQGNVPAKPGPAQKTARQPAQPAVAQPWKQIPIPPLPPFHPAIPKRIDLPNGMILFLQEDHELPLISATARIRGGSRLEPAAKVGLVDIYGTVWRTGGTKTKTGDQMDDYLEARAAKLETDGTVDSTFVSLNCLKQDFDDVFALFLELLHDPAFREDKIVLAKNEMYTAISRRNDDVGQIAAREAAFLAYGKDNPYARESEYATVDAVTQNDLLEWHSRFVHPNNILFGIVGDFDSAQMERKLRQAFESWPKGPPASQPEIRFTPAKPGLYYANKEDVNQSAIRMVTLGIQRDNPDYFAVEVMNEMFGGGFSSRLIRYIRTEQGLAYNVGGGIGAGYDHPGIFRLSMGTKTESTAEGIKALNTQIENLLKEPATADELKRAKDAILNSFIFRFDSPEKVLAERMTYQYYGYPVDFLEQFRAGVEKVTVDDVSRVAHKYVHPGQFSELVVGNDEAEKLLSSLGTITTLDISIPPPPGAERAKLPETTASNPQGKALLAKVVEGMGGQSKVDSIKALRIRSTVTQKMPQGEMPVQLTQTMVFPDKAVQTMSTPMGEMKIVITPAAAFMSAGGQVRELPEEVKESSLFDIKRDEVFVAQHQNDPKFVLAADGTEKIGNIEAAILNVNADGAQTRWYVDPSTGHILRTIHTAVGQRGPVQRTTENTNWMTVDGLTVPSQATISENGQIVATFKVEGVEINPTLDAKTFEKPVATAATK